MKVDYSLNELLKNLQVRVADIQEELSRTLKILEAAKNAWPDHQIVDIGKWHTRDEEPPIGHLWASNGIAVWTIHHEGGPIPKYATSVLYWTEAFIPAPPLNQESK